MYTVRDLIQDLLMESNKADVEDKLDIPVYISSRYDDSDIKIQGIDFRYRNGEPCIFIN